MKDKPNFYELYFGKLNWWEKLIIKIDGRLHRNKQIVIMMGDVESTETIKFKNGSSITYVPNKYINTSGVRGLRSKMKCIDTV